MENNTKYCKKGHHIVDKSNFTADKTKSDGLYSTCKTCLVKKNRDVYLKRAEKMKEKKSETKNS